MRNITAGFRDHANIAVHNMTVVDGVRFMATDEGIDMMNEDADIYLTPSDELGAAVGVRCFAYELTEEDLKAPELTSEQRIHARRLCSDARAFIDPAWYRASRRL